MTVIVGPCQRIVGFDWPPPPTPGVSIFGTMFLKPANGTSDNYGTNEPTPGTGYPPWEQSSILTAAWLLRTTVRSLDITGAYEVPAWSLKGVSGEGIPEGAVPEIVPTVEFPYTKTFAPQTAYYPGGGAYTQVLPSRQGSPVGSFGPDVQCLLGFMYYKIGDPRVRYQWDATSYLEHLTIQSTVAPWSEEWRAESVSIIPPAASYNGVSYPLKRWSVFGHYFSSEWPYGSLWRGVSAVWGTPDP